MILRFILCFFVLLFILIMISRVYVSIYYLDKAIIEIKFWFFKFKFDKKREKKKDAKDENKNPVKDILSKNGPIDFLKDTLDTVLFASKKISSHLVADKFKIKIIVRGEDSASTAIKYGTVCAIIYPMVNRIIQAINIKKPVIEIFSDFYNPKSLGSEVNFDLRLYLSVWKILVIVFSVLKNYLRRKRGFINE